MNASRKVIKVSHIVLGSLLFITILFLGSLQVAQGQSRLPAESGGPSVLETGSITGGLKSSIADVRRYEQQQALPVSAPAVFSGFGDLRRYENQLETLSKVHAVPAGMGDLHLFESGQ